MTTPPAQRVKRLLITGAAGALGSQMRALLKPHADSMRLSDIAPMPAAQAHEEVVLCDLADKQAVDALVAGCDAILHLGGVSVEKSFEEVLGPNISGVFHVYEAARRHGVRRVVFASSNHAIGFHATTDTLQTDCALRPDGYYGLSKAYGELMARFYFDRYGIESACLRIGSSFPEPKDHRMLITWLSYRDLAELVRCCLYTPQLGYTQVFGASDNRDQTWWDNSGAAHLGFKPVDDTEPFRARIESTERWPADAPQSRFMGGMYVLAGPYPM
jgi:uronate dehydrogenase